MDTMATGSLMKVKRVAKTQTAHPFGDERTVDQALPASIGTAEADPFLMCDYFDSTEMDGLAQDEDDFPIDWHPHRGFDIASYLKNGTGRHGDSLGNRVTYDSPGMQWMSTGSGVMHAEGGANEKGQRMQGFQIWINVPAEKKMDDPRYGTVPSHDLPVAKMGTKGSTARILAGEAFGVKGPFQTVQPVQMIDFEIAAGDRASFEVERGLNTAIAFVYEGAAEEINGQDAIDTLSLVVFDASDDKSRLVDIIAAKDTGASVLLFVGRKLEEPIAWRGSIVMNTQQQVFETFRDMGQFPPKRVDWDYKSKAEFPKGG